MYSIYLKDGTEIQATEFSMEPHIVLTVADIDEFTSIYKSMNEENLENIQVYKDRVRVVGFNYCSIIGSQTVTTADGLTVHYYLTGEIEESVDPDYKTAYGIMTGDTAA